MSFKRVFYILVFVVLLSALTSCGTSPSDYYLEREEELSSRDVAYVTLEIEGMGNIKLALDATAAPVTVRHFLKLVSEGFYDGLTFYSAQENFVIQGGDPNYDGSGVYKDENGNAVCIEGEFSSNGYRGNDIKHRRGVISMLRWNPDDSASAQFFICNADNEDVSRLDGYYAPFGYVVDGMDIVDKITETEQYAEGYYGIINKGKQAVIKRATVDDLGGIDINEQIVHNPKSEDCVYKDRDITGRDVVYVDMVIKHFGTVRILLDRTTAPITVDNFVKLVNAGFYDGLTFHRVIDNFMVQGGDPKGDGTGGNTDSEGNRLNIKGEFSSNGHENDILHKRGVISMARSNDKDSASSQFFICNADASHLDGEYASFGYVIDGLDVIDAVTRATALYGDGNGTIYNKADHAVIETIRVVTN